MYLLWMFSEERNTGKAFHLPVQANWSGRLDLSDGLLETADAPFFAVAAEANRWQMYLPEGFDWQDEYAGHIREVKHEGVYRLRSRHHGRLTVIASRFGRENTVMHKYMLPRTGLTIGKGEEAMLRYTRPMVSGKHGEIAMQGESLVFSDHSVNGSWVNGRKVSKRSVTLKPGDRIFIAPALLVVVGTNFFAVNTLEETTVSAECAPLQPVVGGNPPPELPVTREYHRAPRLLQQPTTEPITIEAPIEKDRSRHVPTWLAIGPSMTMIMPMLVSTLVMGRSMGASLVMIGTSSALSVMWSMLNRRFTESENKLSESNRQNICRQYYAEIEERLQAETERERKRLNLNYLSINDCVALPRSGDHRMWERLPNHDDFLVIRLGVGEHRLPIPISIPKPRISVMDDPLRQEPQRLKDMYQMMDNAPITVDPRRHRIIGVLGNSASPWMMQSMVTQIAASHSYHDVRIILIYDEKNEAQWHFAKRLQHVYAADDRTLRMAVCTPTAIRDVLSYFDNVLKVRAEADESSGDDSQRDSSDVTGRLPWYMFFVTDPRLVEDHPVLRYLNQRNLGFTMVMQAEEMESLPKECDLIIEARSELGTVYHSDGTMTGVSYETVDQTKLQDFAKELAPYRIKEMLGSTAIPNLVTFLETYGVRKVEDIDVCHNWSENHAWRSINTIVGLKAGGVPFVLDISDKNHGPHGLIAGTTGAGKSVLLQSFIMSLALNYSPSEVQFILIDYKGGGTSESFRDLPHVAGIIDSSDGARTIFRALASVRGEIKRREAIFKSTGVNNIDDYMRIYNADPTEPTLGHLIIIIDEFAELKKEEPEFMSELVSAARVGRSLGMHLVLATQKPGNSVSDEIDANTRFRICLRVASRADSNDMLKHPDAAYLKGMGRCYVRVGSDEVYEQVQTSWSGASYDPNALRPEEEPRLLGGAGQPRMLRKKKKKADDTVRETTELDVVLQYIRQCCARHQYEWAAQMWLKEMPAEMLLGKLCETFGQPMWNGESWPARQDEHLKVLYAMADDINTQRRLPAVIDFTTQHSILLCGLPGSGKTIALQTIAVALATQ